MKNNADQSKKLLSGVAATLEDFGLVDKKAKHRLEKISAKTSAVDLNDFDDELNNEMEEIYNDDDSDQNKIKPEQKLEPEQKVDADAIMVVAPAEVVAPHHRRHTSVADLASAAWQLMVELFVELPYQPSPELIAFLASMNLTTADFQNTPLPELEHLLNQGWYGRILNAYASNHLLFKIIAWWMLGEDGIKHIKDATTVTSIDKPKDKPPEIELEEISVDDAAYASSKPALEIIDAKPAIAENNSKCKCCNPLINYFSTRVWPKNKILLIESDKMLTKAYTVETSLNSLKVFNKIWAALILSLSANEIYYYYKYPENRYGNTLAKILLLSSDHAKMLSKSLASITVWPELIAFPLLVMISNTIYKRLNPTSSIPLQEIDRIQKHWKHYQSNWQQDLIYPLIRFFLPGFLNKRLGLNPFPNKQYDFNNAIKTILWDGRVGAIERIRLINAIRMLLNKSSKLLHMELLTLMECLAENIHPYDIHRLYQHGYEQEIVQGLMNVQANALKELKAQSQWDRGWLAALYAHFLLWNIGQPQNRKLEPFFWILQTYRWYATIYFLVILGTVIKASLDFYLAKKECEDQGKLWIYMNQAADHECTVCGDLPIYYRHIFANEDCIQAWFETKTRTSQELIDFVEGKIGKVDFSHITTLNFDKQYLNGEDLRRFLFSLKIRAPRLQTLNLKMIRPAGYTDQSIDNIGMQAITDFITEIPVKDLKLELQSLNLNVTKILAQKLNTSSLQTLYLSTNDLSDEAVKGLGQGLSGSFLQALYLSNNNIRAEGAKGLGQGLNGSSLQTLDLSFNNIGVEGAKGLGQGLSGSALQILILRGNNIGDEGAKGLWQSLNSSSLQELGLRENNIGDEGARDLRLRLPGSSLQILNLDSNSIGAEGAKGLGQGLNGSSLQILNLDSNSIGAEGAKGLAQGLNGSSLQWLNLWGNNIGPEGARGLAQVLNTSSIQTLYLGFNNIGDDGVKDLAQKLSSSFLQVLDLSFNFIGDAGAKDIAQSLNNSSLQALALNQNYIYSAGAKDLGQSFRGSLLQTLQLSFNYIGDEGAKGIGQGLNGSLIQTLYLLKNHINDTGAKDLARYFKGSLLQTLFLYDNNIGDEGAKGLGQGLPGSSLKTLDLNSNYIRAEGAKGLGQGLPGSSLQTLELTHNSIGDEGAKGLGQGLPGSSLQTLVIYESNIGDVGAKGLGQGLPGSLLQKLGLSSNNIGDEGAIAIASSLTIAPTPINNNLWIYRFDPDLKKAMSQSRPNTNLNLLELTSNSINDIGALALCRVAPYSGMPAGNLKLTYNPIIDQDLMNNCEISAAISRFELPFHLRVISKLYSSIKEFIWPRKTYRSKFYDENFILIEEFNTENIEMKKEIEPLITSSPINYVPEPLSVLPIQNYQKPFFTLPSTPYQAQNNNPVSSLLVLVMLGMMLFWTFKKLIHWDNHNEFKHHHKNPRKEDITITKEKISINPNNFWLQLEEKQAKQAVQFAQLQLVDQNVNCLSQSLTMDKHHY